MRSLRSHKRTAPWLFAFAVMLLTLSFMPNSGMAQGTPCDCAQRWEGGGHWNTDGTINDLPNAPMANGIIRCASAAETQSQVVPASGCTWDATATEAAGIQLPFGEVCFDPSFGPEGSLIELIPPTHGQPVIWLNFDVRAYASSFSFQINDNSGDVLGWALYESITSTSSVSWNPASGDSLSGDCSNVQLVDFGDGDMRRWCGSESSSSWSTPRAPESFNPLEPSNFYLLIWDQSADGELSVNNFKARFGCSDPTICFLETEPAEIACDVTAGTYTVTVPIIGNNAQYVGTDPNATPTTSEPVCLTNLGESGVITGNIVMTYPIGVDYNISIAPVVPATITCATPDNPTQCMATVSGTAPSASIDVSSTNVTCFGEADGTITATAAAGVSITVDGMAYDATATYGPGSYLVCASDEGACDACETVVISEPAEVILTASSTNVTCFGEEDGTISASATAGASITVDGMAYDPSATYGPGSYLVCASAEGGNDGDVCLDCETIAITEPAEVVLSVSNTDVSCFGEEDATITASATAGASVTVDGMAYDATATYGPGSYLVCASADGGNDGQTCSDCETIMISEPSEVVLSVSNTDVSCFGEDDATITASATAGASITVDGMAYDATATYGAGSYLVCASAEGGNDGDVCTDCETVVISEGPEVELTVSSTDVSCFGATNGTITASASLGAVITVDGSAYDASATYAPGSYLVCATVPGTVCSDCETVMIGEAAELTLEIPVECDGGTGSASALVTGGSGDYDYLWSTGETTPSISGLLNGEHWVMVTDAAGCWVKDSFTVDCEIICEVEVVVEWGCLGESNGWAVVDQVTGATNPTQILWSTGETVQFITGLPSGDHWVMVTDANGCWDKVDFTVDCEKDCSFRTQTQGGYGTGPNGNNPGVYVHANFAGAFPGGLTIGCTNTLTLTSAQAVTNFLPAGGQPNALPSGAMVNPVNYNNTLAAQLVAAKLSVGFDAYDADFGASTTLLGDAYIATGLFAGWTVNAVIAEADQYIGGCGSVYTKSQLNSVLTSINENYVGGTMDNGFISCVAVEMAAAPAPSSGKRPNGNNRDLMDVTSVLDVFEASPNPVSDLLNVRLVHGNAGQVQVDLMDLAGRSIQQVANYTAEAGEERKHVLSVDSLPAGVYLLSVQQHGSRNVQRIVVGH